MDDPVKKPTLPPANSTEPSEKLLLDVTPATLEVPQLTPITRPAAMMRESSGSSSETEDSSGSTPDEGFERVINIKNCPLCHRPRLKKKSEVDIVTHLAICASQDWERVDRIVVGNFVTASQAQRKWYTKVIAKVYSGNYSLGAVCQFYPYSTRWRSSNNNFVELCQHHRPESPDGTPGGRKDAGLR